jgi:ribonuclease-3
MLKKRLPDFEKKIGYVFVNKSLLKQALTHASFAGPRTSYERLEFLGDRVLGLLLAEYFYKACPVESEGSLSLRLHGEARMETLAMIARKIGIAEFIQTQPGMDILQNDNVMADVVESLIASIYLDGGLKAAENFLLSNWPLVTGIPANCEKDSKSLLQEWCLKHGLGLPIYQQLSKSGPDHTPVMTYGVMVEGSPPLTATGGSRKFCEQKAAAALLAHLQVGEGD